MAVHGILILTLFTGMCIADPTDIAPSCPCSCAPANGQSTYTCSAKNLALGAEAVQSSTRDNSSEIALNCAELAVNGNRNPIFSVGSCTQTKKDMSPWWRVELPGVYEINRVDITNRGDCCEGRIKDAEIRIGTSLDNDGNDNQLAATVVSIPLGATQSFNFNPIMGQYVNIIIPGRYEYLTLCEVEVFAVH